MSMEATEYMVLLPPKVEEEAGIPWFHPPNHSLNFCQSFCNHIQPKPIIVGAREMQSLGFSQLLKQNNGGEG